MGYLKAANLLNLLPAKEPFPQTGRQLGESFLRLQDLVVYLIEGGAVCNVQSPKHGASLLLDFFLPHPWQ